MQEERSKNGITSSDNNPRRSEGSIRRRRKRVRIVRSVNTLAPSFQPGNILFPR